MKKIIIILVLVLIISLPFCLFGCNNTNDNPTPPIQDIPIYTLYGTTGSRAKVIVGDYFTYADKKGSYQIAFSMESQQVDVVFQFGDKTEKRMVELADFSDKRYQLDVDFASKSVERKTVTGKVTAATSPLAEVNVRLKDTYNTVFTDSNGEFSIDNVAIGDVLIISKQGYDRRIILLESFDDLDIDLRGQSGDLGYFAAENGFMQLYAKVSRDADYLYLRMSNDYNLPDTGDYVDICFDIGQSSSSISSGDKFVRVHLKNPTTYYSDDYNSFNRTTNVKINHYDEHLFDLEVGIPFADLGITNNEIFGIALSQYSNSEGRSAGWIFNDKYYVKQKIDTKNPFTYVRLKADNTPFVHSKNEYLDFSQYDFRFAFVENSTDRFFGNVSRTAQGVKFDFYSYTLNEFSTNEYVMIFISDDTSVDARDAWKFKEKIYTIKIYGNGKVYYRKPAYALWETDYANDLTLNDVAITKKDGIVQFSITLPYSLIGNGPHIFAHCECKNGGIYVYDTMEWEKRYAVHDVYFDIAFPELFPILNTDGTITTRG